MARMLIPAGAIAQEALRYLHLHRGRRLLLEELPPNPGRDPVHPPGPKP